MELLLGSRSVFSTIKSQLQFRRATTIGVLLLLLWSLSPLGGQASLRVLQRTNRVTRTATTLRYMYTGPYAVLLRSMDTTWSDFKGGLTSALSATYDARVAPIDPWGNVRVPLLRRLPRPPSPRIAGNVDDDDDDGWRTVPDTMTEPEQYSSLVGVPVIGLPADAAAATRRTYKADDTANVTVDFSIETSYMELQCQPWEVFAEDSAEDLARYTPSVWRNKDPFRLNYDSLNENNCTNPHVSNKTCFIDMDRDLL